MTDSPHLPAPDPHQRQAPPQYQPTAPQYAGGQPYAAPLPRRGGSRVLANVVGLLLCVVLTPIGLGLLGHFSYRRYTEVQLLLRSEFDPLSVLGIVAGLLLLLLVAASAAWAPTGPLVAGGIFGVVPGLTFLVAPQWSFRTTFDLPGDVGNWLGTYGALNLLLALGLLLVGAGFAGAVARRAGRRAA